MFMTGPENLEYMLDYLGHLTHQPLGRRERKQQRFKSPGLAQRFLNIQSTVYKHFYIQHHLRNRLKFKRFWKDVLSVWESESSAT